MSTTTSGDVRRSGGSGSSSSPPSARAGRVSRVSCDAEEGAAIAEEYHMGRTAKGTKSTYCSKVKCMLDWMKVNRPDCVTESGDLMIPVEKQAILSYFGSIMKAADDRSKLTSAQDIPEGEPDPPAISTVRGYRSALVDLYTEKKKKIAEDLDVELATILDSYEKKINNLKNRSLMKIGEGKTHLKPKGYELLANKFMKLHPKDAVHGGAWATTLFAWTFLVIMWNLMSRGDSIEKIMFPHIAWRIDCFGIEEQGHKGDQTGENKYSKSLYANPFNPAICPHLTIGVLVFAGGYRPEKYRQQIFPGTSNKERFRHLLQGILSKLTEEELLDLQCPPSEIGPHSNRKGASTYCCGQVAGPSPVTVFLRMGHSLGNLKDRYIFSGEGADELCGRMVALLPFNDESFGVLPPHFPEAISKLLTQEFWEAIIPGYMNYHVGFRAGFPFLLASLIYHEDFLRENLSEDHILWKAPVFAQNPLLDQLRGTVLLGIGYCKETGLRATGIPPHLAIAAKLKDVTDQMEALKAEVAELKESLRNQVPGEVASRVHTMLKSDFNIEGVVPFTNRDFDEKMKSYQASVVSEVRQAIAADRALADAGEAATAVDNTPVEERWWGRWDWSGDNHWTHHVPPGWRFPSKIPTKMLWDLWFFGDRSTTIRPYRLINNKVDISKIDSFNYTRATKMIRVFEDVIRGNNLLPPGVTSLWRLTIVQSHEVFQNAYQIFIPNLRAKLQALVNSETNEKKGGRVDFSREEDISYCTLYKLHCSTVATTVTGKPKRKRKFEPETS
jgi:hypothetical protein